MTDTALLAGLGLKPEHYDEAACCQRAGMWFEVHPENYMVEGGPRLHWLRMVRERHAVSLHGVSLSLAGQAPLDEKHLARLAGLARMIEPALVSEHLAWSAWDGTYFPDLLPFPRTSEALVHIAARIAHAQEALGRRIAIENPSHYLRLDGTCNQLAGHDWDEIDFLTELARRTGCGLLLDVNNVHVSAHNLGFDAGDYIDRFPAEAVMEIHLAGHSRDAALDASGKGLLIDSHDAPISPEVWALYAQLVERIGPRPTLIERDGNLPAFAELLAERDTATALLQDVTSMKEALA